MAATTKRPPRSTTRDKERTAQARARARGAAARATESAHRTAGETTRLARDREKTKQSEMQIAARVQGDAARGEYARQRELAREQYARNREAARIMRMQEEQERKTRTTPDRKSGLSLSIPSASSTEVTSGLFSDPRSVHRIIAISWVAGMSIITWQEIKASGQPPIPKYYVGWSATMGILDLAAPLISYQLAGVFAIGLTIGLALFRQPTEHHMPSNTAISGKGTDLGLGPYKPGQKTNISGGQGDGEWEVSTDGLWWLQFYPWTQQKSSYFAEPYPSSDPTHSLFVWNPQTNSWMLKSKLTGPKYDPTVAPSANIALGVN